MYRMTPPRPAPSLSPARQELRRRTLWLLASVVVVHGVMIGVHYALHMGDRPMKTQQTFIAGWVVLTLAVVLPQMKAIRKLRRPARR